MKGTCTLQLILCVFICAFGCSCSAGSYNFTLWNYLTNNYVYPGSLDGVDLQLVNYSGIGHEKAFYDVLDMVANANVHNLTKNETYAFYINVYNILAVKTVIENPCQHDIFGDCKGCINSIRDVGLSLYYKPVWTQKAGKVAGKDKTLDDIEDFLRDPKPFAEDPRLHASIVCASISCPNLRNESFEAEIIDEQLQAQMEDFLSNTKKGMKLDRGNKKLHLSSIFNWFADDFKNAPGANNSVIGFIVQFVVDDDDREFIMEHQDSLKLEYFDYNWDVNSKDLYRCDSCSSSRPCFVFTAVLITCGALAVLFLVGLIVAFCCWRRSKRRAYKRLSLADPAEHSSINYTE